MDFRFKVCIFCVKPLLITMIVTVLHCQVVCVTFVDITFVDISTYLIIVPVYYYYLFLYIFAPVYGLVSCDLIARICDL